MAIFKGSTKLETITLGNNISNIESGAFNVGNDFLIIYLPSVAIQNLVRKSGFDGSIIIR